MYQFIRIFMIAGLLAFSLAAPSHAQKKTVPTWKTTTATKSMPSDVDLNIMIRTTLLTLNDANLTGNYSVLRDRAAPSFQKANSVKKLSGMFKKMRSWKTDMSSVIYFHPKLAGKPEITKDGQLTVKGIMSTRPKQIVFAMQFEKDKKRWALSGIAVKFSTPKTAAASKSKATKKAN